LPKKRSFEIRASNPKSVVERTDDALAAIQDMCVDHRCFDMLVPEQLLDRSNVLAAFKQTRRKCMAKRVDADRLGDLRTCAGKLDCFAQSSFVDVVAPALSRAWIDRLMIRPD
jgi:hypothetical protein